MTRAAWWTAAVMAALVLALAIQRAEGATVLASAYSPADSGSVTACGPRLDWTTPTVATPPGTFPCGARLRVCVSLREFGSALTRCVVARRTDSGPWCCGRGIDLAPGTWRALGFGSVDGFGVRAVRVERVR